MRDWLWLEDQQATVEDLKDILVNQLKLKMKMIQTPSELINYLINARQNRSDLSKIGLILDVLLAAQRYIVCPSEWTGDKSPLYFQTQDGYDAGVLFYEKFVLGLNLSKTPFWSPPPPVLFLTVLHTDFKETEQRLERIRLEWAKLNNVSQELSKVKWLRKWDANFNSFQDIFREWGEL
jgi:hypothetical protein